MRWMLWVLMVMAGGSCNTYEGGTISIGMPRKDAVDCLNRAGAEEVVLQLASPKGETIESWKLRDGTVLTFHTSRSSGKLTKMTLCRDPERGKWSEEWDELQVLELR